MACRKPFTDAQRKEAVGAFKALKKHFSVLRRLYRPVTSDQRRVLAEYRAAIIEFAAELEKSNASSTWRH